MHEFCQNVSFNHVFFVSSLSLFKNPNLSLFALVKTFFAREDPLLVVFIRQTLISEGKSKRN